MPVSTPQQRTLVPFGAMLLMTITMTTTTSCGDSLHDIWPGAYPTEERKTIGADAGPGITVDLMTFNIKFYDPNEEDHAWSDRRALTKAIIEEQRADVVAMQEAMRNQLDDLGPPEPYRMIATGRDDGDRAGEHAAIIYRADRFDALEQGSFWLSPTPDTPGSAGWGNRVPRICTWARLVERASGQGLYVFNTHFDNQSQPSRSLGIELIAARMAARQHLEDPVVLMGDFNAQDDNAAVQFVLGRIPQASGAMEATVSRSPMLVDAYRTVHPLVPESGTFHRWSGDTNGRRIDFVFVSAAPTAQVLDSAIIRARRGGRYPSDHFPVRARVFLPEPPE